MSISIFQKRGYTPTYPLTDLTPDIQDLSLSQKDTPDKNTP